MRTLLLLTCIALAGCAASTPGYVWHKDATTEADFNHDSFDCKQTARTTAPSGYVMAPGIASLLVLSAIEGQNTHNAQQQIYNECMSAAGYTPREAVQTSAASQH
jgi:hypothetical protein